MLKTRVRKRKLKVQLVLARYLSLFALLLGPLAAPLVAADKDDVARGEYLVRILACGRCHTEGLLSSNEATGPYLAGSRVGVAYTAYSEDDSNPGVVFPSNLTPDVATGLGTWSEEEIIRALTAGVAKGGHERLTVMPWSNYDALKTRDLKAIARFLKSLTPIERAIPDPIPEGGEITRPYVRFGVYQFHPHGAVDRAGLPRPSERP
jgi:cytochrome c553